MGVIIAASQISCEADNEMMAMNMLCTLHSAICM